MADVCLSVCTIIVTLLFLVAFSLPLPIVNIIYAIRDEDEACNKDHHSMGLSLTDVLFWLAIAQFISIGLFMLVSAFLLCVVVCCRNMGGAIGAGIVGGTTAIILVCAGLFITAWTIVGFVVLMSTDLDCLRDGKSIGILMLINFIFLFIHMPGFCVFGSSMSAAVKMDDDDDD